MTPATPTTIAIVTARDTDGYTLILSYSDGARKALPEWSGSVAAAQDRAHH